MVQATEIGRSPSGSGHSAEPEPVSPPVSAVPASVPNAGEPIKRFPAGPDDNATPVSYPALHDHVILRGGERARYFGRCPATNCHRLGVLDRNSAPERPLYNFWLLDDFGRNRCSPGPSDHDFLPSQQVSA